MEKFSDKLNSGPQWHSKKEKMRVLDFQKRVKKFLINLTSTDNSEVHYYTFHLISINA